jgi:hypothetical protein
MDTICLPVRYDKLTEKDVQVHLRHIASDLQPGCLAEFLLIEAGVVIPVVKHIYRSKPPTLDFWFRSGSINRDRLAVLRELLSAEGFELKVSFTSKRGLLRRLVVRLPIDGTVAVSGLNLLRSTSSTLDVSWPTQIAIGYAQGTEVPGLPGMLSFRSQVRNAGYHLGYAVGKLLKKVIS